MDKEQAAHEVKLMTEMIATMDVQVEAERSKASAEAKQMNELRSQLTDLQAKLTDAEAQTAQQPDSNQVKELEAKVVELEQKLQQAQDGNVDSDKKGFADMIARQGTLVEKLNLEKQKAKELEEKVQQNEIDRLMTNHKCEAETQTVILMQSKIFTKNRQAAKQSDAPGIPAPDNDIDKAADDDDYQDDFSMSKNESGDEVRQLGKEVDEMSD